MATVVGRDETKVPGDSAREHADLFHKAFWDAVMSVRMPELDEILGDQRVGVGPKPRYRVKAGRRVVP